MDNIFALDIGTRSVLGTLGYVKDNKFNVIAETIAEHDERAMKDGQIHDIDLVAKSIKKVISGIEKQTNTKLEKVSIAAAGRFLKTVTIKAALRIDKDREIDKDMVRSLELTALKKAENHVNIKSMGKLYCVGYSVKNYYLNEYIISNLLSHRGENIEVEIIATFLPRSVVDSLSKAMEIVGLEVINLTLEPIAAMEAAIPPTLRLLNLALIDIGAGTSDIAISSKDTISAYGMVALAGDEITEVIAQNYLVDFNTAEIMKKQCSIRKEILFTDIFGTENKVISDDLIKSISPYVRKISEEVCNKIIELNGGKPPSAVFLTGGGAYTPDLKQFISENLNIPLNRVGIRSREDVTQCICTDNSLGCIGVTVLGIALITMKNSGSNFMDVILNGSVVSLFNSYKNTVMDAMIQGGINPKALIGKNGKNKKFYLNGIKRISFGGLAENALIKINGSPASIDSGIREGDKITINFAKDGKNAEPGIKDYLARYNSVSFSMNGEMKYLEPVCTIDGNRVDIGSLINEEDDVSISYPETLGNYIENHDENILDSEYFVNDRSVTFSYVINEGDSIESKIKYMPERKHSLKDSGRGESISIKFNGEETVLSGKEEYIFVDVFNFAYFDLSTPKGKLVLLLNGKNAGYNDEIIAGDEVEAVWKNRE
jgi:cell division protein FtsA